MGGHCWDEVFPEAAVTSPHILGGFKTTETFSYVVLEARTLEIKACSLRQLQRGICCLPPPAPGNFGCRLPSSSKGTRDDL